MTERGSILNEHLGRAVRGEMGNRLVGKNGLGTIEFPALKGQTNNSRRFQPTEMIVGEQLWTLKWSSNDRSG